MHAFINAKFAARFLDKLKEGEIYTISNFLVQEYTGLESHRSVRFSKHIYFAEYTRVQKVSDPGLKLPLWEFDLFSLSHLDGKEGDKRYLYGIMPQLIL